MKARNTKKVAVWAASAAAAVLLCSTSVWAYVSPYTYVSLDVNPSIEYSVNRFGRVLSAKAVNDDGAEILQGLNLGNKAIEDAVAETVQKIAQAGYFSGEEPGGVVISTASDNEQAAQNLADDIKDAVDITTQETGAEVEVESASVGLERVQAARALGVTPGKLNLVEKLKASAKDPDSIDINEWLQKPVKDIMKATKENRKNAKNEAGSVVPKDSEGTAPDTSSDTSSPASSESYTAQKQVRDQNGVSSGDTSSMKGNGKNDSNSDKKNTSSIVSSSKENGNSGDNGSSGNADQNVGGVNPGTNNGKAGENDNGKGNDNGNGQKNDNGSGKGNDNAGGKKDK